MGDFELLVRVIMQFVKINAIPGMLSVVAVMALITKMTGDEAWARKLFKGDK